METKNTCKFHPAITGGESGLCLLDGHALVKEEYCLNECHRSCGKYLHQNFYPSSKDNSKKD